MKPFLKWAGGKYRIIDRIRAALPPGNLLIEPFAGSGAVFLNMDYPVNLIADSNADLINVFVPLTANANFADYTKEKFGLAEQQKLADLAGKLMHKGISVVISNHDTEFTRSAYAAAKIDTFSVRRSISSDAENRHHASELLAVFTQKI